MMNFLKPFARSNIIRNSYKISRNFQPIASANLLQTLKCQQLKLDMHSSAANYAATIEANSNGMFSQLLAKFTNSKSSMRASSALLYENISDKIKYHEFFEQFSLPDTFNSWFLVTELHTWMLLVRVMNEGSESGEDGRFLRNCIVETLWADVQTRAKKLNAHNPSATRAQIAILSEQFQASLISYDEGLMSDDKILANALWKRFFVMKCDDYSKLEKLVKYVRESVTMLDNKGREDLTRSPQIDWPKLNQ